MLHRPTREVATATPAALRERYYRALATAARSADEGLAETAAVGGPTLAAIARGEEPTVTVDAAATVLGTADRWPAAPAIAAGAREKLLVGAIAAVADAGDVAAGTAVDLSPDAVRRRLTGAEPATVAEFAAIEAYLVRASP